MAILEHHPQAAFSSEQVQISTHVNRSFDELWVRPRSRQLPRLPACCSREKKEKAVTVEKEAVGTNSVCSVRERGFHDGQKLPPRRVLLRCVSQHDRGKRLADCYSSPDSLQEEEEVNDDDHRLLSVAGSSSVSSNLASSPSLSCNEESDSCDSFCTALECAQCLSELQAKPPFFQDEPSGPSMPLQTDTLNVSSSCFSPLQQGGRQVPEAVKLYCFSPNLAPGDKRPSSVDLMSRCDKSSSSSPPRYLSPSLLLRTSHQRRGVEKASEAVGIRPQKETNRFASSWCYEVRAVACRHCDSKSTCGSSSNPTSSTSPLNHTDLQHPSPTRTILSARNADNHIAPATVCNTEAFPLPEMSPTLLVYCIPGNPGLVHAYVDFAKKLSCELSAVVCVVGHRGHSSCSRDLFGLEDQVTHHQSRLLRLRQKGWNDVLLLGHSIGGYIALRIAQQASLLQPGRLRIGLICPTLSAFSIPRYLQLWVITYTGAYHILNLTLLPIAISAALVYVRLLRVARRLWATKPLQILTGHSRSLPAAGPARLSSDISNISLHNREMLLQHLAGGLFFNNIFSLLRDEFDTLSPDIPWPTLQRLSATSGLHIFFLYAEHDPYVSRLVQQSVASVFTEATQDRSCHTATQPPTAVSGFLRKAFGALTDNRLTKGMKRKAQGLVVCAQRACYFVIVLLLTALAAALQESPSCPSGPDHRNPTCASPPWRLVARPNNLSSSTSCPRQTTPSSTIGSVHSLCMRLGSRIYSVCLRRLAPLHVVQVKMTWKLLMCVVGRYVPNCVLRLLYNTLGQLGHRLASGGSVSPPPKRGRATQKEEDRRDGAVAEKVPHVRILKEVTHSFCLKSLQNKRVAQLIAEELGSPSMQ